MPNGFDFVDQLFSGVIAFVYNLVETAARLLVRPSQAPSDLLRRCRHKTTRQISGITCLALSAAVALMLTLPKIPSLRIAGVDLRTLVPTVEGQVRLATIMPFIIGGIAAAILVDALARLFLAAGRISRPKRPDVAVRLAYAFSFFPIALSIYVALFRFTPWLDWLAQRGPDGHSGAELFVPMLLLLRGCRLVGTTAVHATVPASRRDRRNRFGRVIAAASVFIVAAASLAGAVVASAIANRTPETKAAATTAATPQHERANDRITP
jgi:hypothetical protein